MKNRIVQTLLAALGLALVSVSVFAAKEDCDHHGWGAGHERYGAARFEEHMGKLHDALKLTPAQEAAWTEFSSKVKPANMGKPRMDKSQSDKMDHEDWEGLSTPDRLDKILDNMKSHEKQLAEHAAAVRTFYGTLTANQQRIFDHRFEAYHHRHGRHSHEEHHGM